MISITLYRQIRKIGQLLRGGAGNREIYLGILCGVMLGMIPGFNLSLIAGAILVLLLNANLGFTMLGLLFGTILCYLLAPLSFQTGYVIIHDIGLEDTFKTLANKPVLALMGLDVYAFIGGIPYGIIAGNLFGFIMLKLMTKLRKLIVKANETKVYSLLVTNPISKTLLWLAFGKQKLSSKDALEKESGYFRKLGIILVAGFILIAGVLQYFLINPLTHYSLEESISMTTGAEVNIKSCDVSLSDGKLTITELEITDPGKPTHNLVTIDSLVNDISIQDLLRQNFTIDLMSGRGARFDDLRDKPGKVYRTPEEDEEEDRPLDTGTVLDDYIKEAEKWYEYAKKIEAFLEYFKSEPETEEERKQREIEERERAMTLGYLKASARFVQKRPTLVIKRIEIGDIRISNRFPSQILSATDLSTHPRLNAKPFSIQFNQDDKSERNTPELQQAMHFLATITLNLHEDAAHNIDLAIPNIPVQEFFKSSQSLPFDFENGDIDLSLSGSFTQSEIQLPFQMKTSNLNLKLNEDENLLGMNAKTANEALKGILDFDVEGNLHGKLRSPRVRIDTKKLTDQLTQGIIANGKQALLNQANQAIDKYVDKATEQLNEQVGKELNKALGSQKDAVGNLLNPLKKKIFKDQSSAENGKTSNDESDKDKKEVGEPVKKKAKDLLKKLF